MTKRPSLIDADHPINVSAWAGMVDWAFRQPEIIAQFERATGERLGLVTTPPKNGLEAMIDRATGAGKLDKGAADHFVVWVTENYWGDELVPTSVQKKIDEFKARQG